MKNMLLKLPLIALICIFIIRVKAQSNIEPIKDWQISRGKNSALLSPNLTDSKQEVFIYEIFNPVKTVDLKQNWFDIAVGKELTESNLKIKGNPTVNETNGMKSYFAQATDASGKIQYLSYLGYTLSGNRYRLAKMQGTELNNFLKNFKIAAQHLLKLAQTEGGVANVNQEDASPKLPKTTRNETDSDADFSNVHSVIIHLEYQYGLGGAVYPVYNPYILFKDGTIYDEPNSLDFAASKRNEPTKWGVWRMEGGLLKIIWNAKPEKNKRVEWKPSTYKNALPAKKWEKLNGTFKTISGGGNTALGGDLMIVNSSTITFNDQGQFTLAKVSGGTTPSVTTYYQGKDAGTYSLDGYSIELKYNGGKTERKFFFFYPDNRNYFGIASSSYVPRNK